MPEPPDLSRYAASRAHQARAHRRIPGGAHTYAKGDDQMPEAMPVVIARGEGCRVWDLDGNAYIEYGMGLRSVTLGHAEPRVTAAVSDWLARGVNFSRPASVELAAAEAFLAMLPTADRVKFCKDGSSATTAAVKLARAATGRDVVAFCHDHPFLSADDWFIGATAMDAGIPAATKALSLGFPYGDLDALAALLDDRGREIACVILEPTRGADDATAYLAGVRELCTRHGCAMVLDEMITGMRWANGGAQTGFGVVPDLTTFGKALANGFSVSALAGRAELMDRGGLGTPHDRVFLLSATHGAETHALAACVETQRIYREEDVAGRLAQQGARLREGVAAQVARHGVDGFFGTAGHDANLVFYTRDGDGNASQPYRTLFLQEMVRRGILGPSFVISAAHTDDAVDATVEAVGDALGVYAQALDAGTTDGLLVGRPVQPVFRRRAGLVWSSPPPALPAVPSGDGTALAGTPDLTPRPESR